MKLLSQTELIQLKALAEKGDKEAIATMFYYAASLASQLRDIRNSIEELHNQLKP